MKPLFPYNRIISYGCSFTAGSELTDHEVMGITEEELIVCARQNNYVSVSQIYDHFSVTPEIRDKIAKSNREKSWPNFIAQKYNIPLLNRAINGSSLSHASYRILQDMHNNIIHPTDLILVGITSPNRWFQFNENNKPFNIGFAAGWDKLNHSLAQRQYKQELEKNWLTSHNVIYTHSKEILFLSNLSDLMNGQIKLCYALRSTRNWSRADSDFFSFCDNLIPSNNFLCTEIGMSDLAYKNEYTTHHAFGHPRVEIHKKFADILIEKLEEIYD